MAIVFGPAIAETPKKPRALEPYRPVVDSGPYAVGEVTGEWTDAARDRVVPYRIYFPKTGAGPFPVIVFSHGLGGSRDGYRYLGEHWASCGYVSVHIQHPGSDAALLRESRPYLALVKAARNPTNALERPRDVSFTLDRLEELARAGGSPLKGRLDLKRIGVAGHSFGAYTALVSAGRVLVTPTGRVIDLHDPRIRACIAMSAPAKGGQRECQSYGSFRVPCLHMTGTLDDSPIGGTKAAQRRIPFDCIRRGDQFLVIFDGGDHMIFSGRARRSPKPTDASFQGHILVDTTAFWDAYLRGDNSARAWLTSGGLISELGQTARVEMKTAGD